MPLKDLIESRILEEGFLSNFIKKVNKPLRRKIAHAASHYRKVSHTPNKDGSPSKATNDALENIDAMMLKKPDGIHELFKEGGFNPANEEKRLKDHFDNIKADPNDHIKSSGWKDFCNDHKLGHHVDYGNIIRHNLTNNKPIIPD